MALALTFYTDNLPPNVGGCANAFVVRIRPKYKDDKGIHAHEYEHVKQWWIASLLACTAVAVGGYVWGYQPAFALLGLIAHQILYALIDKYKLYAEAKAFAKQVRSYRSDVEGMAARLAGGHYGLHITKTQAKAEILKYLN